MIIEGTLHPRRFKQNHVKIDDVKDDDKDNL